MAYSLVLECITALYYFFAMRETKEKREAAATVMLTARIRRDLVERLDKLTGEFATRSDLIAWALDQYVEKREKVKK